MFVIMMRLSYPNFESFSFQCGDVRRDRMPGRGNFLVYRSSNQFGCGKNEFRVRMRGDPVARPNDNGRRIEIMNAISQCSAPRRKNDPR